jgi:hypothetical protein
MKVNLPFGRSCACSLSPLRGVHNSEINIPRLHPTHLIVSVSSFVGGGAVLYMLPAGEIRNERKEFDFGKLNLPFNKYHNK